MNFKEIIPDIYYVGVNDRTTSLFESLWPLPLGVSYNSYLVRGSSRIALIDGVAIGECERLRENIQNIIGAEAPDYLIINHMEPDHSGAINIIRTFFPGITIVGNSKTLDMLKGFHGITDNVLCIADGDTLDLGGLTLRFHLTPMVHWPETMVTYVPERSTVFSGDAFGCFGALNGAILDRDTDVEPYIPEMYRYYSNIVGKYGVFVQKAIAKLSALDIQYICPTHGPVWHDEIPRVLSIYDRLSRYEAEDGVVIAYGSMYGNTAEVAEVIAARLAERGIRRIRIHDCSRTSLSYILADIFRYKGLIIGAPTYSNSLFPPVEALVQALKNREVRGRIISTFGSFTWASQSMKRISQVLVEGKNVSPEGVAIAVDFKHAPGQEAIDRAIALADDMADRILAPSHPS